MRLALSYASFFVLCGAALLGVTYVLVAGFPLQATVHLTSPSSTKTLRAAGTKNTVRLGRPPDATAAAPGSPALASAAVGASPSAPGSAAARASAAAQKAGPPGAPQASATTVRTAQSAQRAADLHALVARFALALGLMTVLSSVLGWLMAGRVLRPLRHITATARHIAGDNLHQRLALAGPPDEITDLADTIDALLARLESAFDAQRAFVANASHELRTPLAMMRTSLDVAAAKSPPVSNDASALAAKVREGLDQADRLVESFLVLARAERGLTDDRTSVSVSLAEITADAIDANAEQAKTAGVALSGNLDDAKIAGSPNLLSRLAANLVDNAIRYNHNGGWVRIATTTKAGTARLTVDNSGPLLDPSLLAQLGRPFRRGGAERTGSDGGAGLGLSIVAAIAAAHQGSIALAARPEGGLQVTVALPLPTAPRRP